MAGVTKEKHIQKSKKHILILAIKYILIFGGCLYLYDNSRTIKHNILIKKSSILPLGPYNACRIEMKNNYTKLIDLEGFKFLINSKTCDDYNAAGFLLVVIVHSAPENREKRRAIRYTWGKNLPQYTNTIKVLFMLGTSENRSLSIQILVESRQYQDLVQGNFKDAYRNMTYKHVMGLKWVYHHCRGAKYILKTDDDVFINMRYLLRFLVKELSPFGTRELILCSVIHQKPVRTKPGKYDKWYVTKEEYPEDDYPPYCNGPMILYSADVITRLLEMCEKASYFFIDDIQVTGICAKKIGVVPTDLGRLMLDEAKSTKLAEEGPKSVGNFITGPWTLSPEKIKAVWKELQIAF